jgi:MFS family permease
MNNRWAILAVLVFARTMMAFQYQSVAALSPGLMDSYLLSITEIGLLIGLFLGPGIVVALPGGAIAARFGDKRVTALSLLLMLGGGLLLAYATTLGWMAAGRILSGIGGVMINVILTKMVVDWFAGREIGTAMGLLIAAWPFGIALALALLPALEAIGGLEFAWNGTLALLALALLLFLLVYKSAAINAAAAGTARDRLKLSSLLTVALLWAFYNAALAMVFGFGPLLLIDQKHEAATAAATISVYMLTLTVGVPFGGILSDRTGRGDLLIAVTVAGFGMILLALPFIPTGASLTAYAIAGFISGLPAGIIMTLPARVLAPGVRALGMGVFFTVYYAVMLVAPGLAGALAEQVGDTSLPFTLGAAFCGICLLCFWLFGRMTAASAPTG